MYTHKITKNSSRFNSRLKQNCNQDPSRRYTPRGRGGKNWNRKNLEQLPRRKISRYVFGVYTLLFTNFKQRCVNLCGMDRGNVWLENKKRRATFMRLLIYLERESWRSLSSRILGRKVSTTIVVPRSPELCLRESRDF